MTKVKCRECGIEKFKVWNGAKRNGQGGKVYTNESGKWWNGLQCPDCKYAPKVKELSDGLGQVGPSIILDPDTARSCRKCGKNLPSSRYFAHAWCVNPVEYWDMAESYGFMGKV